MERFVTKVVLAVGRERWNYRGSAPCVRRVTETLTVEVNTSTEDGGRDQIERAILGLDAEVPVEYAMRAATRLIRGESFYDSWYVENGASTRWLNANWY